MSTAEDEVDVKIKKDKKNIKKDREKRREKGEESEKSSLRSATSFSSADDINKMRVGCLLFSHSVFLVYIFLSLNSIPISEGKKIATLSTALNGLLYLKWCIFMGLFCFSSSCGQVYSLLLSFSLHPSPFDVCLQVMLLTSMVFLLLPLTFIPQWSSHPTQTKPFFLVQLSPCTPHIIHITPILFSMYLCHANFFCLVGNRQKTLQLYY